MDDWDALQAICLYIIYGTIFMGFGLDDDRVHSPNEKFELDCYRMGARSHAVLMGLLLDGAAG
jgi:acetylornithine deacetylase/succinyl-diaminopimelate desuccinylase-like protein